MKIKQHILILLLLVFTIGIYAQDSNNINTQDKAVYSDRITDDNGTPLEGITVRVKGKGFSTKTNSNGEFTISAQIGDIIVLSKNGKIIDSYRYDGSLYYEVEDHSETIKKKKRNSSVKKFSKYSSQNNKKYKIQLDSALFYVNNKPIKSIDFIGRALEYAGRDKQKISQLYEVLGDVYIHLKQYDLAVSNYKIAFDNKKNSATQLKLANAQLLNNEFQKSEQQFRKLLKRNDLRTVQKIATYEGLGDIYFKQKNLDKALQRYKTALNLSKRLSNSDKISSLSAKVASVLEAKGKTNEAESYLLNTQNLAIRQSPEKAVIESNRAADFYSRNNNVSKEILQRQNTLDKLESADLEEVVVDKGVALTKSKAKLDLGKAYLKQNKLNKAIPLLEESAIEAESDRDIVTQKDAVQNLSEAYVSLGDDDKALYNYKKYVGLVDALYKQKEKEIKEVVNLTKNLSEKQNRITSLEKDRELSDNKLKLYQTENQLTIENDKRQKTIIYALLAGLVLLLLSLFWMFRSNKQRKLANNLLALKSLRTQMNPHFIFNALNSVNSFIAQNDERTANRYLTDFSTLMRSVLENSEEDFISLEKEVELLELYLKLEHSRFKDKFEYELLVDKTIDLGQFQIPPMLLQPYVENAVWHGLRYKKEKGFLKVQLLKKDEETIQIEITDNGIGRKKSAALKTDYQKKKKSKGMQNIKQRIAILNTMYKDKIDVFIEDLYKDTTGTKVLLTLKKD